MFLKQPSPEKSNEVVTFQEWHVFPLISVIRVLDQMGGSLALLHLQ